MPKSDQKLSLSIKALGLEPPNGRLLQRFPDVLHPVIQPRRGQHEQQHGYNLLAGFAAANRVEHGETALPPTPFRERDLDVWGGGSISDGVPDVFEWSGMHQGNAVCHL